MKASMKRTNVRRTKMKMRTAYRASRQSTKASAQPDGAGSQCQCGTHHTDRTGNLVPSNRRIRQPELGRRGGAPQGKLVVSRRGRETSPCQRRGEHTRKEAVEVQGAEVLETGLEGLKTKNLLQPPTNGPRGAAATGGSHSFGGPSPPASKGTVFWGAR